jgi:NADP-dependent 3-hydroxy acid dehydrogenase YdfG
LAISSNVIAIYWCQDWFINNQIERLGETDTGGQVSVTQVRPKYFNGTKFQRRRRKKRSRVKWKQKNNTVFPTVSDITALPRHFTFWPLTAM